VPSNKGMSLKVRCSLYVNWFCMCFTAYLSQPPAVARNKTGIVGCMEEFPGSFDKKNSIGLEFKCAKVTRMSGGQLQTIPFNSLTVEIIISITSVFNDIQ
jgi:hypothetical protein